MSNKNARKPRPRTARRTSGPTRSRAGEPEADTGASDAISGRTATVSGAGGLFRLRGLGRDAYRVTAKAPGYSRVTTDPVEPGSPEPVTLRLSPGVDLRGIVRTPDGEPLGGADVRVEQNATTTDAGGGFVIDGVTRSGGGNPFEAMGGAARRGGDAGKDEDEDEDSEVTVRASARGLRFSGTVVDRSGVPAPRVMVFLGGTSDENAAIVKTTLSDDEGAFRLGGLENGPYRLQALGSPGQPSQPVELEEDITDYVLEAEPRS